MFVGWLHDRNGSYTNGFAILIVFAVIGIIAVAMLPKNTNAEMPVSQQEVLQE
jgi:cyanate permease